MTLTPGMTGATPNKFIDNITPTVVMRNPDASVDELFHDWALNGNNPEYQAFESRINYGATLYRRTAGANVWEYINDTVDGSGGFANGAYLFPFTLELQEGTNLPTLKYQRRQEQADYDNFAHHVCNTPWDVIVGSADLIERKSKPNTEAADRLDEFWRNCDRNGTAILDFLEFPHKQGRRFGTGIIVMDRPDFENQTEADNKNPENRPWVYAVPTQNVVHWEFDDDGSIAGIVILEPQVIDNADGGGRSASTNVRVWTKTEWAVFRSTNDKRQDGTVAQLPNGAAYELVDTGTHTLGEVPIVAIYNDPPRPGNLLAHTEMLDVARLAQTVYNIDSEAREIERKCALFLAIPVKNVDTWVDKKAVLSTDNALLYDGEAGAPAYISPDLQILERLADKRKQKKLDAYQMAGLGALAAITEAVKTASGYHAEVEFAKTERRIARHAAMLEAAEKRLARLYLKYYGIDSDAEPDLYSVTYPRDFGVRDMDALINRTTTLLGMNLGDDWDEKTLEKMAKAQFPRLGENDIQKMVQLAVKARAVQRDQQQQLARAQSMAKMLTKPLKEPSQAVQDRNFAKGEDQSAPSD